MKADYCFKAINVVNFDKNSTLLCQYFPILSPSLTFQAPTEARLTEACRTAAVRGDFCHSSTAQQCSEMCRFIPAATRVA